MLDELMWRLLWLSGLTMLLTGCVAERSGPADRAESMSDRQAIDVDGAKELTARIDFPAGEFTLAGGGAKLLEGAFEFEHERFRPVLDLKRGGGAAELKVSTKPGTGAGGGQRARWEVRLSDQVPVRLDFHMGAGQARLDAGTLLWRGLAINMGVGQLTLDLRGRPRSSYDVEVNGGVGEGRIHVPGSGLHAEVRGGIGEIEVKGPLRKEGSHYYSADWHDAQHRVTLRVRGGIGKIELIAAE